MSDSPEQLRPPELPQRLRRNKLLLRFMWVTTVLLVAFLFFSRTRTFQVYHHRTALRTLGESFVTPAKQDWKACLSPRVFIWLMTSNLTLQEKMERAQTHMDRLIELGYLERKSFRVQSPNLGHNHFSAELSRIDPGLLGSEETTIMFTDSQITVTAPASLIPRYEAALAKWQKSKSQSNAPALMNSNASPSN